MVRQKNPKLKPEIQKEGCYMLSAMKKVQELKTGPYNFDDPLEINKLYDKLLEKKIINARCLMSSPTQFFEFFGLAIRQRVKEDGVAFAPTYMPFENDFEILCFKTKLPAYTHFVMGDGKGSVAWDPMGESDTKPLGYVCSKGKLDSKRIFSILKFGSEKKELE
jgi:hypothetical protein